MLRAPMDINAFWSNPDRYVAQNVEGACLATASTALRAQADELSRTWQTTGFYTWQEMSSMLAAVVTLTSTASNASGEAGKSCRPCGDLIAARDAYYSVVKRSNDYVEIWKHAQTTNAIIDAPAFKPWVVSVLRAGAKLMREAEITSCTKPWWLGALRAYVGASQIVANIAITIGKTVAAVGQAIIKAGGGLARLWPFLKWGGLGLGVIFVGVFTYNKLVSVAESGRYKQIEWGKLFRIKKFAKPDSVSGNWRR